MTNTFPVLFEGSYCTVEIDSPATGVALAKFVGQDVGEFGAVPMHALESLFSPDYLLELFIDARETQAVTIEVSHDWAVWMGVNRQRFKHVSMLTGSRFVTITASFVRRFANLENVIRVYTEAAAFDEALEASIATVKMCGPQRPSPRS